MPASVPVASTAVSTPDRPSHALGRWWRPSVATAVTAVGVLSAVVVAAILRLQALGAVGFGSDEAVYAGLARDLASGELIVRAHPPLWLAVGAALGEAASDSALRALSAVAGIVAVLLSAAIAASLPVAVPKGAAVVAAWIVAVMPYHVDVSRQFILDGPATTALAGVVLAVLRFASTGRQRWLAVAGACTTLALLIKETTLLGVAAVVLMAVVAPAARRRQVAVVVTGAAVVAGAIWFTAATVAGQAGNLSAYAGWQLERAANQPLDFYGGVVAPAVGIPFLLAAAVGAGWLLRHRSGGLVVAAVLVPLAFLQLWPVKGYAYLVLVVPALAALSAVGIVQTAISARSWVRSLVAILTIFSVSVPLTAAHASSTGGTPLPGRDGLPDVREAAAWMAARGGGLVVVDNVAVGNVVRYYSGARVEVLGHEPGDRRLNPAYREAPANLPEPAFLVWDAWTAAARPLVANELIDQARLLHARVGFVGVDALGDSRGPVVVVFEVPR